jgi:uncharacterized protein YceK
MPIGGVRPTTQAELNRSRSQKVRAYMFQGGITVKRFVACLVLASAIGLALSGCSSAAKTPATSSQNSSQTSASGAASKQTGTFLSYELVDTGTTAKMPGGIVGKNGDTFEPSGKALVKLADGTQIAATCSIQNLKPNDTLVVQKDSKGVWAVISKS